MIFDNLNGTNQDLNRPWKTGIRQQLVPPLPIGTGKQPFGHMVLVAMSDE